MVKIITSDIFFSQQCIYFLNFTQLFVSIVAQVSSQRHKSVQPQHIYISQSHPDNACYNGRALPFGPRHAVISCAAKTVLYFFLKLKRLGKRDFCALEIMYVIGLSHRASHSSVLVLPLFFQIVFITRLFGLVDINQFTMVAI